MISFMICNAHILFGLSNKKLGDGRDVWHLWEIGKVRTGFWWGNIRERRPLERPRRKWEDNIKMDLQKVGWGWTGLSCLRIGTGGGLL